MMRRIAMIALPLFLLSACSIMDISMQDTAVPLAPDKVEFSLYEALGVELSTMLDENTPEQELGGWFVSGVKFGIGLSPKADLNGRLFYSGYTLGAKLGPKLLLSQTGKHYLSLLPALTFLKGSGDPDYPSYSSFGGEITLLSSWVPIPSLVPTLGARISYDNLTEGILQRDSYQHFGIFHGNLSGNLRLVAGAFFVAPELGVEIVPLSGGVEFFPTGSLGIGLKF